MIEFLAIALTVFLTEICDKTMIAASVFALQAGRPFKILAFSIAGYVAANALPVYLVSCSGFWAMLYRTSLG